MTPEEVLFDNISQLGYSVYPIIAPQNKKIPFIIYNVTANTITTHIDGSNSLDNLLEVRFLVSVYAKTYKEMKSMVHRILDNLININNNEYKIVIYGTVDSYDENGYRSNIDLKIYQQIN